MTSDIFFGAGILMSSKILGAREKSPIYEYLLSYYAPFGIMKNLFKMEEGMLANILIIILFNLYTYMVK